MSRAGFWRNQRWYRAFLFATAGALLGGTAGCAPQALLVRVAADSLAEQAGIPEDDLTLAREASAFYLKLSESILIANPGHLRLAEAVAGGFTQYAYAFVAFEAERLESRDARAARDLRERAARLYRRAHLHAMKGLETRQPGFAKALQDQSSGQPTPPPGLPDDQVALAYWAAASWGAYIALSKDRPDAVADLPQVILLARMAFAQRPNHGEGALLSLMASLEAARPGGSLNQANDFFERAILAGAGRQAAPLVTKAETLALAQGDRSQFEALLRRALEIGATHPSLINSVMRERAQWLLDTADDRF